MFVSAILEPVPVIFFIKHIYILSRIFFVKSLAISVPFIATFNKILPKRGMSRITPPNCIIF